jgi:hypothetical protein
MMASDRPKFAAKDLRSGSEAEKAEAANTYISYAGKYDVYPDRVVHHVELCLFPNWVGTDLVRNWSLEGNRLTLTTPPAPVGDKMMVSHLVWEKVAG